MFQRHGPQEHNVAEPNCVNKEMEDRQTESCCIQVTSDSNAVLLYVAAQHGTQRLISLLEPPDEDFGISYTTLFGWAKVTNAWWLLTLFAVLLPLPPYFCFTCGRGWTYRWCDKFAFLPFWPQASCCWRHYCRRGGRLSADGALKRFCSWDSKWSWSLKAAIQFLRLDCSLCH